MVFEKENIPWNKGVVGLQIAWNRGLSKEQQPFYGKKHSSITKNIISQKNKGMKKPYLSERNKTREMRIKVSLGLRGIPKSESHRKNLSLSLKGKFIGKFNHFYGEHHTLETRKKIREKKLSIGAWKLNKNPKWKGGIKYEKYGMEFDEKLKNFIRERDNFECQLCKNKQTNKKLDVHHIDENKKNNTIFNLVSLCHHCHITLHNKKILWKKLK